MEIRHNYVTEKFNIVRLDPKCFPFLLLNFLIQACGVQCEDVHNFQHFFTVTIVRAQWFDRRDVFRREVI